MSRENVYVAEAEALGNVEGNMCGVVMRDAVALPRSETTSCRKGTRRNLESDGLIVPMKRSNKVVMSGGGECGGKEPG